MWLSLTKCRLTDELFLVVSWTVTILLCHYCSVCCNLPVQRRQRNADSVVGHNESEETETGNGESETSAGTHPQTRTHKERTGMCWTV